MRTLVFINDIFEKKSVIDRFKQISPKLMFSVTSVGYNGKKYDHRAKLTELINGIVLINNFLKLF
jgi:hypothetical protein